VSVFGLEGLPLALKPLNWKRLRRNFRVWVNFLESPKFSNGL